MIEMILPWASVFLFGAFFGATWFDLTHERSELKRVWWERWAKLAILYDQNCILHRQASGNTHFRLKVRTRKRLSRRDAIVKRVARKSVTGWEDWNKGVPIPLKQSEEERCFNRGGNLMAFLCFSPRDHTLTILSPKKLTFWPASQVEGDEKLLLPPGEYEIDVTIDGSPRDYAKFAVRWYGDVNTVSIERVSGYH